MCWCFLAIVDDKNKCHPRAIHLLNWQAVKMRGWRCFGGTIIGWKGVSYGTAETILQKHQGKQSQVSTRRRKGDGGNMRHFLLISSIFGRPIGRRVCLTPCYSATFSVHLSSQQLSHLIIPAGPQDEMPVVWHKRKREEFDLISLKPFRALPLGFGGRRHSPRAYERSYIEHCHD